MNVPNPNNPSSPSTKTTREHTAMSQGTGGRGVARLPNECETEGGLPLEHDDGGYRQGKT
jgi:hypothetical protein